ncbi:MAG TPA: arginine--tRNA ligase [Steroidobacteraceae bacterium]|nr:arginine--tRNA ligase [Steroidobacteraceae bacterium]HRX90168.1 arginine--tRNA ligase [Steroidobacteraceae bacterium]
MKAELEHLLRQALASLVPSVLPDAPDPASIAVERTRDPAHGDFATNVALRLAKTAGRKPRELAQAILEAIPPNELIAGAAIAGAGFINFRLAKHTFAATLQRIHDEGERFGRGRVGAGTKVLLEFVSANPTGPMHVGHGRQAAYGATLGNLLVAAGFDVQREFYINDAGRQIDILAVSVYLRYLEASGETLTFPVNGYRAAYILPVAAALRAEVGDSLRRASAEMYADAPPDAPAGDKDKHIDALIGNARRLLGAAGFERIVTFARDRMLAEIRDDLDGFGVSFDRWYSERELETSGAIDRALNKLRDENRVYEKDGAEWFRAVEFGDDEDRVVVRENGLKTYFASDIAYHYDKRQRGFDKLIDVLGADHHGYVARVRGGLVALGEPADCLEVCLVQLVSLFRNGEKLSMGKREGNFVTLRQLRDEVGNDACRLFYLMRSNDQHLDFDLELAKSRSNENPVYYIQYAHARVASVLKQLESRGLRFDRAQGLAHAARLTGVHEEAVLTALSRYPEVVEHAALARAPHALVHYLRELANSFHTYYNAEQFIVEDAELRNARLALVLGVQQVIRNGLGILGVAAPETM